MLQTHSGSPISDGFQTSLRCGHCKRLKPEFEKAASGLLANDPPVSLVKVDCTEGGKATCGRYCFTEIVMRNIICGSRLRR